MKKLVIALFSLIIFIAVFATVKSSDENYRTEQKIKQYVDDLSSNEVNSWYHKAKTGDGESAWRLANFFFLVWSHPKSIETIDDELLYLGNHWLDVSAASEYPYAIIDMAAGINGVFEDCTYEVLSNQTLIKKAVNHIVSKQICNKVDLWYKYVIYSQLEEYRDDEKAAYWKYEYENNNMN